MRGRYDDSRGGRRERSRSRSNSRERKRYRDDDRGNRSKYGHASTNPYANNYIQSSQPTNWNPVPESPTVCIKGLPTHTTEPTLYAALAAYYPKEIRLMTQRTGDCKGYAFVEFVTLEHAQYFMMTFAGSAGDPHAPQFIVENRAVLLEYAKEKPPSSYEPKSHGSGVPSGADKKPAFRSDWLCTKCSCHNFAKRDSCFKCESPRSDYGQAVVGESSQESVVATETPSAFLAVRGFNPYISELQVAELFRQFAVVKSVVILKDPSTNYAKGLAFVEFHTVEYATYALQNGQSLHIDAILLKVSFARESVMHQLIQQSRLPGSQLLVNPLAAAALQSAQWSSGAAGFGAAPPMAAVSHQPGQPSATAIAAASALSAKPKSKYPLQFETNGGAYVFQTKSGCFLDPVNEFFYCTRSKLYYSARDGTYLTFEPTASPPYKKFEPPLPSEPESTASSGDGADEKLSESAPSTSSTLTAKDTTIRLPVSLGGLKMAKSKTGGAGGSSALGKKVLENMAKWGALQEDDPEEEGAASGDTKPVKTGITVSAAATAAAPVVVTPASVSGAPVLTNAELSLLHKTSSPPVAPPAVSAKSASGATTVPTIAPAVAPTASSSGFVCLLCRRQFNSAEMLGKHERESKLHADNLKAQQEKAGAAAVPVAPQYRDRAAERRERVGDADSPPRSSSDANHPSSSGGGGSAFGPSFSAFVSSSGHTSLPAEAFSYSAAASGSINSAPPPPAVSSQPVAVFQDASNPGNAILRKMGWSDGSGLGKDGSGKEEAVGVELANSRAAVGSLAYAAGNGYRDTLKNATRARFDQLNK